MATNPYAAPQARVDDTPQGVHAGQFEPEGQALAAGQGWQWIVDAWILFKRQPALWIGITLVLMIVFAVLSWIPFLGQIAISVLTPVLGAGILLGCKALEDGEPLEFSHLFAGFKTQTSKLILVGLFSLLALAVFAVIMIGVAGASWGLAMLGGSPRATPMFGIGVVIGLLLGMAVIVPFYMALWFAPALVVFHDFEVAQALKTSFFASLKNVVPFLIYGLALMVLGVVAMIPIGLGLFVLLPVVFASVYTAYRDIFFIR